MSTHAIRCYDCGKLIGQYRPLVEVFKRALNITASRRGGLSHISVIAIPARLPEDLQSMYEDLYSALGVDRICCRTHLTTSTIVDSNYVRENKYPE